MPAPLQNQSPEQMDSLADEAELFARKLREVAKALKTSKIPNVEVQYTDGVRMAVMVTLPAYLLDCRRKALEAGVDLP